MHHRHTPCFCSSLSPLALFSINPREPLTHSTSLTALLNSFTSSSYTCPRTTMSRHSYNPSIPSTWCNVKLKSLQPCSRLNSSRYEPHLILSLPI
ncbi:hypothetical protein B0O80DRAFT_460182, partial [Mortierella sp. GBAus27b]